MVEVAGIELMAQTPKIVNF